LDLHAPPPVIAALLVTAFPADNHIRSRAVLQRRTEDGRGRVVERVTLMSGRTLIVKERNDRTSDRETLLYRHALPRAGDLVPRYAASATIGDTHLLALEDVGGTHADGHEPASRDRAMAALARFHRHFAGATMQEILGAAAVGALGGEATPNPIERSELLSVYQEALAGHSRLLSTMMRERALHLAGPFADALAASPLVLDPGDVRPENVLVAGPRTVLIDFENAAVRTRADANRLELDANPRWLAGIATTIAQAPTGGVLVHCHAGKDRTGIVAALLLGLIGVPDEVIAADYALSSTCLQRELDRWLAEAAPDDPTSGSANGSSSWPARR